MKISINQTISKTIVVLLFALGLGACNMVGLDEVKVDKTISFDTVTVKADIGVETKLTYGDNGSTAKVDWAKGKEKFSFLYNGDGDDESYLFTQVGTGSDFTCIGLPDINYSGQTLYAIYPGSAALTADATTFPMDISTQSGLNSAANNPAHTMVAEITGVDNLADLAESKISFVHKVATLKLTVKNDDFGDLILSDITLSGTNLRTKATYTLNTRQVAIDNTSATTIKVNSAKADENGNCVVYVDLFPDVVYGDITISARCGGRRYTGTLSGSSSALQAGKMYTTEIALTTVDLLSSMTFRVQTTEANQTFTIPFVSTTGDYILYVDWDGDNNIDTTIPSGTAVSGNALFSHEYSSIGIYTITLSSTQTDPSQEQMPNWFISSSGASNSQRIYSMDTPMLRIPGTAAASVFRGNSRLIYISPALFVNNPQITLFNQTFYGCGGLTSIPEELFAYNVNATNFNECFNSCIKLESIPADLFKNNIEVETFSSSFRECFALTTIPSGLFDNNVNVSTFDNCFYRCTTLLVVPSNLFDKNTGVTNFSSCFFNCETLETIPDGLFDKNTEVTTFAYTFKRCSSLVALPQKLFVNNKMTSNFTECFYYCNNLVLNRNIFCEEETEMLTRFADRSTMNFGNCFYAVGASLNVGEGGTAPALWDYVYGEGGTITKTDCFQSADKMTNVSSIPAEWR